MKLAFAHNVYNRPKTLNETIRIERELYPDSTISVAYNNRIIENHFLSGVKYIYYPEESHKIGCTNGFIHSIRNLMDESFDCLIFTHDDVRISNPSVFEQNLELIIRKGYDVVVRTPAQDFDRNTYKYVMMEAIFLSSKGVSTLFTNLEPFKNEWDIDKDNRNSISPEIWLGNLIYDKGLTILLYKDKSVPAEGYNNELSNSLGFTHLNPGIRGWNDNFKI